ncbi:MAG: zf-HC2 domain-containing protein [Lachnospiraceae bacterium]|jgi:hypothetical protein|nr:zf-HC2 domain-containing protein [Lachnospiraceae bacterium]
MKITCNVIKDLLPLYVENIASDDTRILVEEHINSCNSCKKELDKFNKANDIFIDMKLLPIKKVQATLRKKKYLTILFSAILTLLVLIIVIGYLTAPEYIPYSESAVSITEADNNLMIAHLGDTGFRYSIDYYRTDDNSGYIYDISMWNSIWNRTMNKNVPADFILNPNGEMVSSVYYCSSDGKEEDILIYGKNQNPNGGRITLPRLFLAYYVYTAAVSAVVLWVILFLFRKKQKMKAIMFKLFALPIAYLLGHICIKGFSTISYSATHDFYAILLAMIPIYCAIMIGERIFASRT